MRLIEYAICNAVLNTSSAYPNTSSADPNTSSTGLIYFAATNRPKVHERIVMETTWTILDQFLSNREDILPPIFSNDYFRFTVVNPAEFVAVLDFPNHLK